MKIIGLNLLHDFCLDHADCRQWIENWIADVRESRWQTTHDIRSRYSSASFLVNNLVIFNVKGNNYRLETQIAFNVGIVAIKWIGTHAEYTRRYS
ncbi:MAG: type II toxin-antitoxin system HigB family toxin [Bdellovibrionia bacterium]